MHNFHTSFSSARGSQDLEQEVEILVDVEDTEPESDYEEDHATVNLNNAMGDEDALQSKRNSKADIGDTVGIWLAETYGVPLLNKKQEIELAKRIERMIKAENALKRPGLSDFRRQHLEAIVADGKEAKEAFLAANVRLAQNVARMYLYRGVALADLIQEANMGLMTAIERYDYHRGTRFSTYATFWIRQSVSRAVADQGRTIRIPVHTNDQLRKIMRLQQQYLQEYGELPTEEELAQDTGIELERVRFLLTLVNQAPDSLDRSVGEAEDDSCLGDFIEDDSESIFDLVVNSLCREKIFEILDQMRDQRQAEIIKLRYGLTDGEGRSTAEIAAELGIDEIDVNRLEYRAKYHLKGSSVRSQLIDFLSV